jgi:hypothetical protein
MAGQAEAPAASQRRGREGARWINQRPTPEEFAAWAQENIRVAEGLKIEDYLGGIVLIPAVDKKSKFVDGFTPQGEPKIGERPEMVYVPYAKVETRLQYFWDLLELEEAKWVGVIEPIVTERPELDTLTEVIRDMPNASVDEVLADLKEREIRKTSTTAAIVHQLPPGFFLLPVPMGTSYTYFLCCSYRVAIYERDNAKEVSRPIREGRGTKQVALITKGWQDSLKVDENAIMKCETGAIGRALGAAGIFTIPGSGIATAEDMLEQAAGAAAAPAEEGAGPEAPAEAPAPAQAAPAKAAAEEPDDEEVRDKSRQIVAILQTDFPSAYAAFGEWCSKRRPKITSLNDLEGPVLRGVHTKLLKLRHIAEQRRAETVGEEPDDQEAAVPSRAAQESAETGEEGPALI